MISIFFGFSGNDNSFVIFFLIASSFSFSVSYLLIALALRFLAAFGVLLRFGITWLSSTLNSSLDTWPFWIGDFSFGDLTLLVPKGDSGPEPVLQAFFLSFIFGDFFTTFLLDGTLSGSDENSFVSEVILLISSLLVVISEVIFGDVLNFFLAFDFSGVWLTINNISASTECSDFTWWSSRRDNRNRFWHFSQLNGFLSDSLRLLEVCSELFLWGGVFDVAFACILVVTASCCSYLIFTSGTSSIKYPFVLLSLSLILEIPPLLNKTLRSLTSLWYASLFSGRLSAVQFCLTEIVSFRFVFSLFFITSETGLYSVSFTETFPFGFDIVSSIDVPSRLIFSLFFITSETGVQQFSFTEEFSFGFGIVSSIDVPSKSVFSLSFNTSETGVQLFSHCFTIIFSVITWLWLFLSRIRELKSSLVTESTSTCSLPSWFTSVTISDCASIWPICW